MIDVAARIIGAGLAILFVGFLALRIAELPLTVIVVACSLLMVYALYDDARPSDLKRSQRRAMRVDNASRNNAT